MKILDFNNQYLLLANSKQIFLVDASTFRIVSTKSYETSSQNHTVGSLQYSTGIGAISIGSVVHLYGNRFHYERNLDFTSNSEVYSVDTYKKVLKLCLRKNILVVVSEFRIMIHNLLTKSTESYLETINGFLCLLLDDYYHLSMFYPSTPNTLIHKELWAQNTMQITGGVKYQMGSYFCYTNSEGSIKLGVCLVLENVLSFYAAEDENQKNGTLIKVYGFEANIKKLINVPQTDTIVVMLENGEIYGQDLKKQYCYDLVEFSDQGNSDCQVLEISEPEHFQKTNYKNTAVSLELEIVATSNITDKKKLKNYGNQHFWVQKTAREQSSSLNEQEGTVKYDLFVLKEACEDENDSKNAKAKLYRACNILNMKKEHRRSEENPHKQQEEQVVSQSATM